MDRFSDEVPDNSASVRRGDRRRDGVAGSDRIRRQREYQPAPAWWLLAFGTATLVSGMAVGHGLLVAAGLMLTAAALCLLDVQSHSDRHGGHPHHR